MPVRLNGSTSGYVELAAPAVAGSTSLELPTDSIKPGLVLVAAQSFSAVSSVSVNNCFTATYENYRMVIALTSTTAGTIYPRLRAGGTDTTTGYYFNYWGWRSDTNSADSGSGNNSGTPLMMYSSSSSSIGTFDVLMPQAAQHTYISGAATRNSGATIWSTSSAIWLNNSSQYDGITLTGAGAMTGSIRIYGYRSTV